MFRPFPFFLIIAAFINPLEIFISAAILICVTLAQKRYVQVHQVNRVMPWSTEYVNETTIKYSYL